jgi:ABC-type bacteriocin/lantibiotic exporter with double-glycine peptidase domain
MHKVPVILQLSDTECGIAALAMILAYYQFYIPLDTLREKCGTSRDGSKAATLIKVAEDYKFDAAAFTVELAEIYNLKHPVIAFWNFSHYVVITGATKNKFHIIDPAIGAITINQQEFDSAFTGVIIEIKANSYSPKLKPISALRPYIQKWLLDFKIEWSYLFLVSLLMVSGPLLSSAFTSVFINYCLIGGNARWLPWLGLLATISAIIFITSAIATKVTQFKLSTKTGLLKLSELALHLLKLPTLFYALRQKNEIITIITRSETIFTNISKSIADISINFILACIALGVMIKINFSLSLVSILIATISLLSIYILKKQICNLPASCMPLLCLRLETLKP